jgi:molybdate transport system ATP-binding protein
VSVTREPSRETSILNVLPVTLESLHADGATVMLRLRVAAQVPHEAPIYLLARITRKSCDALALKAGDALWAQVKGVALMSTGA